MINVENVSKWYGSKLAVDDVSFQVNKGEVLAFIGPNGAGKSTTMRMVTGFIPASKGIIAIDGHDMENDSINAKSMIGYLPENAPLYNNMTVLSFLAFTAEIRGLRKAEKKKAVDEVITKCFLEPVRHQSIDTLSKGYRHRTCFAQAIIHNPDILILDEPTDGLDPNQKREVRNLIKEMGKNKAIIISTHILEEVEAVASRVILINNGKNVFDGTPDEFKSKSSEAGIFTLEVLAESSPDIINTLKSISCVHKVTEEKSDNKSIVLKIYPEKTVDRIELCKQISDRIKTENWAIGEFRIEQGQLNEVFYNLTLGNKEETKNVN